MNFHHFTRYLFETGKEFVSLLSQKLFFRTGRHKNRVIPVTFLKTLRGFSFFLHFGVL